MRNSSLTTVSDALLLTLAFVMFIDSVLEMKDTIHLKQKLLLKIFQNDRLNPIQSISVARTYCDVKNDFQPFFNYTFEGIDGGSYDSLINKYSDEPCRDDEYNCVNIPTINKQYLTVWRDKVLCLKRVSNSYGKNIISSNNNCSEGYKQCGYYNNFKDKFCVMNGNKCPINYIKFKTLLEINLNNTEYEYINLDGYNYLVTSTKKINETLPIDFKVEQNYPCLEIDKRTFNPEFVINPRTNNLKNFGCNETIYHDPDHLIKDDDGYDKRYFPLIADLTKDFLFNNDLLEKYSSLPNTQEWKNDIDKSFYFFWQRNYISVNLTCTDFTSFSDFKENLEELKVLKFLQMVFALGNVFILCFFISLLSLVKIVKRWLHSIITLIKILLSACYVTFNINGSGRNFKLTEEIMKFLSKILNGCVDEFLIYSMKRYDIIHSIREINYLNKFIYYFSTIYGIITAFQFIRLVYKVYIRVKNNHRRKTAREQLGSKMFAKLEQERVNTSILTDNLLNEVDEFRGVDSRGGVSKKSTLNSK